MTEYKSSQQTRDRAKAWSAAHPERRREIQRAHYWRNHERKIGLPQSERFAKLYEPCPMTGCWLWTASVNRSGYGKATVDGKDLTAHRWSWLLHKGDIPNGLHVLHHCDVPGCVNPAHLWLGTNQENDADKRMKGRHFVQPIHREAKLTEDEVMEIRRLRGVETVVALGKRFGVHHSHISRVQRGKFWAHLPQGE